MSRTMAVRDFSRIDFTARHSTDSTVDGRGERDRRNLVAVCPYSSDVKSIQQQARAVGFLYLVLALTAPFGLMYVSGKLIVHGNATATADNLRASEWLLRAGIASELTASR